MKTEMCFELMTCVSPTYFLQLYFGLTPSLAHAFFRGEPSLKSAFLPFADNIVICSCDDDLRATLLLLGVKNALVKLMLPQMIAARKKMFTVFIMIFLRQCS